MSETLSKIDKKEGRQAGREGGERIRKRKEEKRKHTHKTKQQQKHHKSEHVMQALSTVYVKTNTKSFKCWYMNDTIKKKKHFKKLKIIEHTYIQ